MLEPAITNTDQLVKKYLENIHKEKNKYLLLDGYADYERVKPESNDLLNIKYVSKDNDGEVIGYFEARNNIHSNFIESIVIMNFTDKPNLQLTKDFIDFLQLLLCKRAFRKVVFFAIPENPVFDLYIKFIDDTQVGDLVGILKKHNKLVDGIYYDLAIFEIHKEKFEEWYYKKRKINDKCKKI